jgi:predicted N-acetyltransferase YhbS
MTLLRVRLAHPSEMDDIYLMGFDVWGEGESQAEYLNACSSSPKYARGRWYVLADDEGRLASSLITYRLAPDTFGLGSIATAGALRRQGLAARLIDGVLRAMKRDGARAVFLHSDIDQRYYEKLGFEPLPDLYQIKKGTVCMVWGVSARELTQAPDFKPPPYF